MSRIRIKMRKKSVLSPMNICAVCAVDGRSDVENCASEKLPYANAVRAENGQLPPVPEMNDSCEDIATNEIYEYGSASTIVPAPGVVD